MQNQESIIDVTQNLLKTLSFDHTDDMKSSLKELSDTVIEHLNEDPVRTLGVAFSLGFALTNMLRAPGTDIKKKLANAAGAALVYGVVNPILKSTSHSESQDRLH